MLLSPFRPSNGRLEDSLLKTSDGQRLCRTSNGRKGHYVEIFFLLQLSFPTWASLPKNIERASWMGPGNPIWTSWKYAWPESVLTVKACVYHWDHMTIITQTFQYFLHMHWHAHWVPGMTHTCSYPLHCRQYDPLSSGPPRTLFWWGSHGNSMLGPPCSGFLMNSTSWLTSKWQNLGDTKRCLCSRGLYRSSGGRSFSVFPGPLSLGPKTIQFIPIAQKHSYKSHSVHQCSGALPWAMQRGRHLCVTIPRPSLWISKR